MNLTNLACVLDDTAREHPERTAIVCGERRLSYRDLEMESAQIAHVLVERGIKPGDAVALICQNVPEFTTIYYGILKAGAVVVPLNILLKPREIAYHLADSGAKACVAYEGSAELPIALSAETATKTVDTCSEFFVVGSRRDGGLARKGGVESPTIQQLARSMPPSFSTESVDDEATAVILYTSGTTGQPKGAELRHRNLRDNLLCTEMVYGIDRSRPDTYLCVLPLFHSFGQTAVQNGAIAFGGTIVMLPRFDASAALRLMAMESVTIFCGVPTMYWGLLNALDETVDVVSIASTLRVAASGGAPLAAKTHRQFHDEFGTTILEGYGLSETSPTASSTRLGDDPRIGSVGVPIPGVEMKLINDDWTDVVGGPGSIGEIAIKGHNVMKGYFGRPEATAEAIHDGWFRSGDLARKDEDGFYYIVDRSKDMIIRGGFNVYPREIEEVFMTNPDVSLVAVVGVPHPSHGEEIVAYVLRKPGATSTADDLVSFGREQLAAYKYPREVRLVDEMPMTSTGKILKRMLAVPEPQHVIPGAGVR